MKQLGEIVGVSESAIWNYEAGKREPDYEMLLKLSEAIGCTVADIMEDGQSTIENELAEELQILKDNLKIGENYITILMLFSEVFQYFSNFSELFRCAKSS